MSTAKHWFELPDGTPLTAYRLCVVEFDDAGKEVRRQAFDFSIESQPIPPPDSGPVPDPIPPPVLEFVDLIPSWSSSDPGSFRLRLPGGGIPRDTPVGTIVGEFVNGAITKGSTVWHTASEARAGDTGNLEVPTSTRRKLKLVKPVGGTEVVVGIEQRDGTKRRDHTFTIPVLPS